MKNELDKITPLEKEFGRWYTDVVKQGGLIEYGPVQGTIIYKPIAFGMWELIRKQLDIEFAKEEVQNVYLPLLIPLSYIEKEKDHIEGFAPELATITKVGNKELDQHIVIRPTSEVLFAEFFRKEVGSYNSLPQLYNQWANILRWEKTTSPFLRGREILWQEGHTAHANPEEARALSLRMIKTYSDFARDYLAIPTIIGEKTENERFSGADHTYTIEAMMKDGRALQSGTSHDLGQNFSKSFDIKFKSKENKFEFAYQTSWGVSTRLLGAIIMSHGDNRGIVIPPKVAPTQVDIIEIFGDKNPDVRSNALAIKEKLTALEIRSKIDSSSKGPGFKAGASEIKGTPLRIEVGPRDLANNQVTFVRRDTLEKTQVDLDKIDTQAKELLDTIQQDLLTAAIKRNRDRIKVVSTYEELKDVVEKHNFAIAPFNGSAADEEKIQADTGITTRCILEKEILNGELIDWNFDESKECIITKETTNRYVVFAKAY